MVSEMASEVAHPNIVIESTAKAMFDAENTRIACSMKTPILSGVVLARNEARTVERTLKSLSKVCDEIVFVDGASTDGTLEIAKKYSSKVFERPQKTIVETERAFAISKATGDWIIYLDGDEWLSDELSNNISDLISKEGVDGYGLVEQLFYKNMVLKWGYYRNNYQVRLYRKDAVKYNGVIHEQPQIKGQVRNVDFPLLHFNKEPWNPIPKRTKRWLKVYALQTKRTHSRPRHFFGSLYRLANNFRSLLFKDNALGDGIVGFEMNTKLAFYYFLHDLYVTFLSERGN
jgi:glycosyltransferase involved in cell wall biosynthesis